MDEAKMRGIDIDKLRGESFYNLAHHRMVEMHEAKAKLFRDYAKLQENTDNPAPNPKVAPVKKPVRVVNGKKYQFTDTQIRIAQAVLDKEKKNK